MTNVRLGDLVTVSGGGTPRKSVPEYYGGGIPWVTPKDMKRRRIGASSVSITEEGVRNSPAKLVAQGSVLVVVRSGVLKHTLPVALTTAPVTLNQDLKALTPREGVDPSYLARMVKSLQPTVLTWVRATTADNFPIGSLLDLEVALPPLAEQQRIAAILDRADAIRAKRKRLLTELDSLLQSIFNSTFGDVRTNIYKFPVATVDDVTDRVTDGEHKTPRRSPDGFPLLSARNIRDGWIDFANVDHIDGQEYALLSRRIEPQTGDILISCSGSIGRVARVTDQYRFAMVRSAALIRPATIVAPVFLERLLATPTLKAMMIAQANSSAQANLFQNQIKRLPVLVPPMALQREFAIRVERIARYRLHLEQALTTDDELFTSLQSRAFRGEL